MLNKNIIKMFPNHFKRPIFRKPEPPLFEHNSLCKHKVLILKEYKHSSLFLEPEMMKIRKEYTCSDCGGSFKVMPSKIKMII